MPLMQNLDDFNIVKVEAAPEEMKPYIALYAKYLKMMSPKKKNTWELPPSYYEELADIEDEGNNQKTYRQISDEMFYDLAWKENNLITHFYKENCPDSQIMEKHLRILADKYPDTCFRRLNLDKYPNTGDFYVGANVKDPAILVIQNKDLVDRLDGFIPFDGKNDFDIEILEWRFALTNAIKYEGDMSTPPKDIEKYGHYDLTREKIRKNVEKYFEMESPYTMPVMREEETNADVILIGVQQLVKALCN